MTKTFRREAKHKEHEQTNKNPNWEEGHESITTQLSIIFGTKKNVVIENKMKNTM